jgi:hypothetical protein
MYTAEFGLAMWHPGTTNIGDIGYFRGGGFARLGENIFDEPFSFGSSSSIVVSKTRHVSGGIRSAPPVTHYESVTLAENR